MTSAPPSSLSGSRLRRGTTVAGITLEEPVVRGERVHVWRGHRADGAQVTVHALVDAASAPEVDRFLEAARRLAAIGRSRPLPGVVDVILVAVGERLYVSRGGVAGTMDDLALLGWGLRDSLTFVRRLCRAIREVHRHGLVHGCAAPSNILLDDNLDPRLSDVGAVDPSALPEVYVAPEVRQGEPATVRSDVFGLGRLIALILIGETPHDEDEDVPRLAELDHHPPGLARIVRRATVRDPRSRYGSVDELMADLERYEDKDRVGVPHREADETLRASTPPSWRPEPLDRRQATTPRQLPRRASATPREVARSQRPTPREIPRSQRPTPRAIPRSQQPTPRGDPQQSPPSGPHAQRPGAPPFRVYRSVAPPPGNDDILTVAQARLGAAVGAAILAIALGFAFVSATAPTVAVAAALVGAAGLSLLVPPVAAPWLSRILTAIVVVAATWAIAPVDLCAVAGRHAKLESGSPLERGRRLALIRARGVRDFTGVDLSGADLTGLDLAAIRFDRANLRAARLDRARLSGASLREADLTAADLAGADLSGVDVASARGFAETRCDEATVMPVGWRCRDGAPRPDSPFLPE